ncbi:hypothetical protein K443DRAFT_109634 [Laccaria amethystina LaAM-08-1]|uniref:Uncharacterized protein n=1 Tax=Laccaria amethystina LaAM-08-1 TaxID=1095629 RepID=A0A0C9WJL9_9AGAR|nr:hypothetical protein K443DRAFT_109634 [Laccaria amethystina LaAM-08-1]
MLRKLREGATTLVSWEKSPKKEVKHRLQIVLMGYKRLQKSDMDYRSLLIPLTKVIVIYFVTSVSTFSDYKIGSIRFVRLQKLVGCALGLQKFVVFAFDITKLCSLRFLRLQKFVVSAFLITKAGSVRFFHYKSL